MLGMKNYQNKEKIRSTSLNSVHLLKIYDHEKEKRKDRERLDEVESETTRRIRAKEEESPWRERTKRKEEREREKCPWREETGREKEGEGERGERVQRGHSSHDIKRGCRPADSKDSARSAMKRGRTVRRNGKKIGKNEGKEETAGAQSFVRYSCSSAPSLFNSRLI